jgi:hypothetical protein
LAVIFERRRPGAELVFVCEGGPAGRATVPFRWTDRALEPLGHRLAPDGLVELAALAAALGYPRLAARGQA